MKMKKFALALILLALSADAFAPPAGATTLNARDFAVDGVYRRARAARRTRSRGTRNKSFISNKLPPAPVTVTEVDAEGLKKLLQRGEAGAARPLLINFWATWCVPCRTEFPDLVKIYADYQGHGVEFAVVSADDVADIKTDVPKFLREMRATAIPAYLLNATDTEAAIAQVDPTWGGELPATFLFDRQGKLVFKHTGIINAAQLRAEIEKAVTSDK
ncbi:MAG TPA: redoxin domain-containing protein [Pyrinomonadaceae bacterium]|nr:redoxin domain-containing protein [Pyrinomonadaceae bacterium]